MLSESLLHSVVSPKIPRVDRNERRREKKEAEVNKREPSDGAPRRHDGVSCHPPHISGNADAMLRNALRRRGLRLSSQHEVISVCVSMSR